MGVIARLEWGTRRLDLESAPFSLRSFVPPAVDEGTNVAVGTSANRLGGGEVVSYKAKDRGWGFSVRILGSTSAELDGWGNRLENFIGLAKDKTHKLYFSYKPKDDYSFDPLWGQFGGVKKYHIKSGVVSLGRQYSASNIRHEKALIARLSLTIAPYADGLEQRLGSAIGGVLEDTIGTPDGISRGTIIPEATTNKFTNPIFGHSTWNNGYTAAANIIVSENTDKEFITHGTSSAKITSLADAQTEFYQTINVGNASAHTLSCYVKKPDGTAVTDSDLTLYYGAINVVETYTSEGNGWYRVTGPITGIAAGTPAGVRAKERSTIYVDGLQLETKQDTNFILFNGSTTEINFGSDAGLDDLHDDAFTAEAWIRADGYGENNLGIIFSKQDGAARGWRFQVDSTNGLTATIEAADTDAYSTSSLDHFTADGNNVHVAMTYDDAGDREIRLWVGGSEVPVYGTKTAAVGAIVTDAAADLTMGDTAGVDRAFDGRMGWSRISDNERYTSNFTPTARCSPPASDGDTVGLWHFDEGTGATLDNEEGTAARDGTASNHVWGGDCVTDYATPLAHGDMMGVAWSTPASPHASTSIRTAARVRVANANSVDVGEGTFRVVWKTAYPNTHGVILTLFYADANGLRGWWDTTGDVFSFRDNTNTIVSSAQTFSAGDIFILHFVYESGSLKIYKDGAEIATGSTYTPPTLGTNLYIGTNQNAGTHANGTLLGFATFNRAMSATEALADYNNINAHVSGGDGLGQRLESIPREWTKDGDSVVDMYDDSTHDDWAICEGIPGSAPADTIFHLTNSATDRSLILGLLAIDRFIELSDYFTDEQGIVDGTALSGQVKRTSVGTGGSRISGAAGPVLTNYEELIGQPAHIFASMKENAGGTNLQIRMQLDSNSTLVTGEYKSIVATASIKQFLTTGITMPIDVSRDFSWMASASYAISLIAKYASGTANVDLDFWRTIFGKVATINIQSTDSRGAFIRGSEVYGLIVTTNATEEYPGLRGDEILLEPDKVNHLIILSGDEGDATVLTATVTATRILVTPRWSLV